MAYENVSYKEAVQIKKMGAVNSAYSFADKVLNNNNLNNTVKEPNISVLTKRLNASSFPQLPVNNFSKKKILKKPLLLLYLNLQCFFYPMEAF